MELIAEVYRKAFDTHESFEATEIGAGLAYLFGAIAVGNPGGVDYNDNLMLANFLQANFPPQHEVWYFVQK